MGFTKCIDTNYFIKACDDPVIMDMVALSMYIMFTDRKVRTLSKMSDLGVDEKTELRVMSHKDRSSILDVSETSIKTNLFDDDGNDSLLRLSLRGKRFKLTYDSERIVYLECYVLEGGFSRMREVMVNACDYIKRNIVYPDLSVIRNCNESDIYKDMVAISLWIMIKSGGKDCYESDNFMTLMEELGIMAKRMETLFDSPYFSSLLQMSDNSVCTFLRKIPGGMGVTVDGNTAYVVKDKVVLEDIPVGRITGYDSVMYNLDKIINKLLNKRS